MEKQSGEFLIRLVGIFSRNMIRATAQLSAALKVLAGLNKTEAVHSLKRHSLKNADLTVKLQIKF